MDILVVAPMEKERDNFLQALLNNKHTHNHYILVTCGVGKISAAMRVQNFLATNADMRIDMIALVGYAGGASGFTPGDLAIPDTCTVWDADTPHLPIFDEMHKVYALKGSENVTMLTGDTFVDRKTARKLEHIYGPNVIYDMEGAAVAAVAERERLPLLVMKIISDVSYHKPWKRYQSFEAFVASNKDFGRFLNILEQF